MSYKEELFEKLLIHSAGINKTFVGSLTDVGRQQFDVEARNMCYKILDKEHSLSDIGRAFNKDHATVMHGIKKHDIAYARKGYYADNYDDLVLIMAENTTHEEYADITFTERNRIRINNLEEEKGRLKEELFDIKRTTKLLLRSLKEQGILTKQLEKACN